ncbi:hypothetical protein I203_101385 [Kwoniella mangroviensis CBS 8507]|uniref:uncharacterized protein n=1 Tax=Kwoniella mangroviensis CBS 8507 TaxID=1296122 RepID=UPI00305CB48D
MLSEGKAVGFEAWVESKDDKIRLNEHQVTYHPPEGEGLAYSQCFLETIDQPFRIKLCRLPTLKDRRDIQLKLYIDGNLLKTQAWRDHRPTCEWDRIIFQQEQGTAPTIKSLLRFTPHPSTHDPDEVTITSDDMQTLGTIEIIMKAGSYSPACYRSATPSTMKKIGVVNEKERKLPYSTSATDCEKYEVKPSRHYKLRSAPEGGKLYRFLFKYRPRPALILLGLIHEQAKSPSPPRASLKRKVSPIKDAVYLEDHQESPPSSQQAKRIRYLEDQLQQLSSQRSQSLETASRNNEIIDLTSVDDA